ncbi:NAD-binding protein [Propionibacterium sp.]|uniref:potassium channel family protein n=1 Tax=Propionibacterium sp. TaxID=1977903 RepID=UPI00345E8A7A
MPASSTRLKRPGGLTDVFYLIMRRMRFPLILLIVIYTICTVGLGLIPGVDDAGNPTPAMGLFNAFYVVSYTGATIGFGEIPQPYSAAQRMWMTMTIYMTVVGWSYSLVNILALVQERAFQNALRQARFTRRIYGLREPFYIVAGAGETGALVCHGLDRLGLRFVVVERNEERLARMRLEEFRSDPPLIVADASQPSVMRDAGLVSPHCRGVLALTEDDSTNQAIAVTTRLLAPRVVVLARIRNVETETHVGVFGGDLVINPFERFARQLASSIIAPERYRLREILTGLVGEPVPDQRQPPRGHWIMCGYGRFGHAMVEELRSTGIEVTVIDEAHFDQGGVDVRGTGTDSESLIAAGVKTADGIVAGNASDTKNLAIAVTARELNPGIFIVTRQNQTANTPLFDAFLDDLSMVPSHIVAQEFLARITTPLLGQYLKRIDQYSEKECAVLSDRLTRFGRGRIPELWDVVIRRGQATAVSQRLASGHRVTLADVLTDPDKRTQRSESAALMVRRGNKSMERPELTMELRPDDRILFAGSTQGHGNVSLVLQNANALGYVQTGQEGNGGVVWRWITGQRRQSEELHDHDAVPPQEGARALAAKQRVARAKAAKAKAAKALSGKPGGRPGRDARGAQSGSDGRVNAVGGRSGQGIPVPCGDGPTSAGNGVPAAPAQDTPGAPPKDDPARQPEADAGHGTASTGDDKGTGPEPSASEHH